MSKAQMTSEKVARLNTTRLNQVQGRQREKPTASETNSVANQGHNEEGNKMTLQAMEVLQNQSAQVNAELRQHINWLPIHMIQQAAALNASYNSRRANISAELLAGNHLYGQQVQVEPSTATISLQQAPDCIVPATSLQPRAAIDWASDSHAPLQLQHSSTLCEHLQAAVGRGASSSDRQPSGAEWLPQALRQQQSQRDSQQAVVLEAAFRQMLGNQQHSFLGAAPLPPHPPPQPKAIPQLTSHQFCASSCGQFAHNYAALNQRQATSLQTGAGNPSGLLSRLISSASSSLAPLLPAPQVSAGAQSLCFNLTTMTPPADSGAKIERAALIVGNAQSGQVGERRRCRADSLPIPTSGGCGGAAIDAVDGDNSEEAAYKGLLRAGEVEFNAPQLDDRQRTDSGLLCAKSGVGAAKANNQPCNGVCGAQHAVAANNNNRVRTAYSSMQILNLEREFTSNMYLSRIRRIELAQRLSLSEKQVKIWFQNRRVKYKKENSKQQQQT